MTKNVVTRVSTKKYKEGWDRIFGENIWKCPACGKEVDYGKEGTMYGKTYCSATDKIVKMVKVRR